MTDIKVGEIWAKPGERELERTILYFDKNIVLFKYHLSTKIYHSCCSPEYFRRYYKPKPKPKVFTRWLNVYDDGFTGMIYHSREEAVLRININSPCKTIPITW